MELAQAVRRDAASASQARALREARGCGRGASVAAPAPHDDPAALAAGHLRRTMVARRGAGDPAGLRCRVSGEVRPAARLGEPTALGARLRPHRSLDVRSREPSAAASGGRRHARSARAGDGQMMLPHESATQLSWRRSGSPIHGALVQRWWAATRGGETTLPPLAVGRAKHARFAQRTLDLHPQPSGRLERGSWHGAVSRRHGNRERRRPRVAFAVNKLPRSGQVDGPHVPGPCTDLTRDERGVVKRDSGGRTSRCAYRARRRCVATPRAGVTHKFNSVVEGGCEADECRKRGWAQVHRLRRAPLRTIRTNGLWGHLVQIANTRRAGKSAVNASKSATSPV
jgi:hypothetical protein